MTNSAGYYYSNGGGERLGPVAPSALAEMLNGGMVTGDTLVWRDGMAEWARLASSDLGHLVMAAAPKVASEPLWPRGPAPGVSFIEAIKICFGKYATFEGRASRSEFWYFFLFVTLANIGASVIDVMSGTSLDSVGVASVIFQLAVFLPSLSVGARRLHDIDKSAWWLAIILVPLVGVIVLIVFWASRPVDPNRFG